MPRKWPNGDPKWPWLAFSSFYVDKNYLDGKATLIEPGAQFQNGFGANMHVKVVCAFDLNLNTVEDVSGAALRPCPSGCW
jgi:hypothetical protein